MPSQVFGWEQLRRALCQLRKECKARVAVPDPWWPLYTDLQVSRTFVPLSANTPAQLIGADANRVAIWMHNIQTNNHVDISPALPVPGSNACSFSLIGDFKTLFITPPDFGPVAAFDWYAYSQPGNDTVALTMFTKAR